MHDASIALERAPRAGLNYLFFDKGMNLLPMSGVLTLGGLSPNVFNSLSMDEPVAATEPGYLIVYVDNQSLGKDVWFDNIQILHYNAEVQEETHYYPFGLTVSSTAASPVANNPYKYNGKELENRFGLEMYDFHARQLDPQLGKTWQIDPHADRYPSMSPYSVMGNNPINTIAPDGRDIIVLRNSDGAHGTGHAAILVGNNSDGWTYISKDGFTESAFGSQSKYIVQEFSSIEEFRNSPHNFVLADGTHSTTEGA